MAVPQLYKTTPCNVASCLYSQKKNYETMQGRTRDQATIALSRPCPYSPPPHFPFLQFSLRSELSEACLRLALNTKVQQVDARREEKGASVQTVQVDLCSLVNQVSG